jgi:hypothetical protein
MFCAFETGRREDFHGRINLLQFGELLALLIGNLIPCVGGLGTVPRPASDSMIPDLASL